MERVPKLRFKEFTEEWEEKKLEKVSIVNPKLIDLPKNFFYIDLESVESGMLKSKKWISKEDAPSRAQRTLEKGDILFQTVRPYQQNNLYFQENGAFVASTGYAQIRAQESSKYLYQFLHTSKFLDDILEKCIGTSFPAINSTDLKSLIIKIPQIEEQEKIANYLSGIDDKIEVLEKRVGNMKEFKKALLQQMFI